MFKSIKFKYFFALYVILLSFCVFNLYPAHDDWGYASPKPSMNIIAGIMPTATFWRPFDRLIEYGLGFMPSLWPSFNHLVILAGFFITCIILHSMLEKVTQDKFHSFIGSLFFCFSPAIIITVTNSDYINQPYAFLAGLISLLCFFNAYYKCWLIFAALSVLFKENGIVWFLAPVFVNIVYVYINSDKKFIRLIREKFLFIIIGLLGMITYFAVRFFLLGKGLALGASVGRYQIIFSPIHILKNYVLILGGAATSVDALAFFLKPRNFIILIITFIVSVIFLGYIIACLYEIFRNNKRLFAGIIGFFVCALYISSPYTLAGQISDAMAYEMSFMLALMLGVILSSSCRKPKFMKLAITAMFASMIFVCAHKILVMHDYTLEVHNFLQAQQSKFENIPSKALIYFIEDIPEEGYGTYKYDIGHGLHEGHAFNSLWGWKAKIDIKTVKNFSEIKFSPETLPEYDTIFSLTRSGSLEILRN